MYYITRFGTYNFLTRGGNPVDTVASGGSYPSTVRTPDGWYDFRHDSRAPRDLTTITTRKLIYAPNCVSAAADVYRELRALRGTRARLFRTWKDTPLRQEWTWARLEDFDGVEEIRAGSSQLFTVTDIAFTQISPYWYGQGWGATDYTEVPFYEGQELTASQAAADALISVGALGTTTKTIHNRGNRDVLDVRVDLINLSISATNYTVRVRNITDTDKSHGWIYDATSGSGNPIGSGAYVRVHGGRRTALEYAAGPTVTNTFAEFTRVGANEQWLALYPGDNTIEVQTAGAGAIDLDVQLSYHDAWE